MPDYRYSSIVQAVYEKVKHANGKEGTETKTITKIALKRNVENL